MGNVNLPTPVALAAGSICVLGGYLLGVVAGPDNATRVTAVVDSYDRSTSRLCLTGEEVDGQAGTVGGVLCGTWRRTQGSADLPSRGDEFRFVSVSADGVDAAGPEGQRPAVVIYGDVLR